MLSVQLVSGLEYDHTSLTLHVLTPMSPSEKSRNTTKVVLILTIVSVAASAVYFYDKHRISEALPTKSKPDPKTALTELFDAPFDGETIRIATGATGGYWFEQSFSIGSVPYHVVFGKTQKLDPATGTPLDSHVQGVSVGAMTYRLDKNGWRAIGKQTEIGEIGSWGDAPEIEEAEILVLSPAQIVLLIDFGYGMGGYVDEGKVLLGFDGARWRDLGFVQTGGNNGGACDETPSASGVTIPCWSYTGSISVLPEMHDGYPDLLVERTGTQSGDERNPVLPADNAIYRFDGDKYADTTSD